MADKKTVLKNKVVELVVIEKRPNSVMRSGADVSLLKGSSRSFQLAKDTNGFLIDPLTKEERDELESILGFDLSIYTKNTDMNPKANYWISHRSARIKLTRTSDDLESATIKLNLADPIDFIRYKICLVSPKVANNWTERGDPNYIYALRDVADLDTEIKNKIDKEDTVLEYLFANKKSKKKMFNLLRLYGAEELPKNIKYDNHTANWMYTQLRNLTHNLRHVNGLYAIISIEDNLLDDRIFLEDAISCGIVSKFGSEYKLSGGGTLGYTERDVIVHLNKPEYQNTRLQIEEAVNIYFKTKKTE